MASPTMSAVPEKGPVTRSGRPEASTTCELASRSVTRCSMSSPSVRSPASGRDGPVADHERVRPAGLGEGERHAVEVVQAHRAQRAGRVRAHREGHARRDGAVELAVRLAQVQAAARRRSTTSRAASPSTPTRARRPGPGRCRSPPPRPPRPPRAPRRRPRRHALRGSIAPAPAGQRQGGDEADQGEARRRGPARPAARRSSSRPARRPRPAAPPPAAGAPRSARRRRRPARPGRRRAARRARGAPRA